MYEKPLGYAGDHEVLSSIYRREDLGKTLFARCLHRYYVNNPNARAVRNRTEFLLHRLNERVRGGPRPLRVLAVACGPAREIEMLLAQPGFDANAVEIHLMDQDLTALQAAQKALTTLARTRGIRPNVHYVHVPIRHVVREGIEGSYDLIYSAGVFDYFADPLARLAATTLVRSLAPEGELVIGNFSTDAHGRSLMGLALDWHLVYRSEADLRSLYGGVGTQIHVEAEPEGVNFFVTLRR